MYVNMKGMELNHVAFADDLTGAGKLQSLKCWWDSLITFGPLIGYQANPSKSWLIVKPEFVDAAIKIFENSKKNVTSEGKNISVHVLGVKLLSQVLLIMQ